MYNTCLNIKKVIIEYGLGYVEYNSDIPMTTSRRYGRGEMPEFDGLLYFNCDWATKQDNFKATFGTTLANNPMLIIMLGVQTQLQIMLLDIGGRKKE